MAKKETTTTTRGGARSGAGRPRLAAHEVRVAVSLRVSPENAELLARMRSAGIHLGMAFDGIIPELAARFGIE